MFAFPGMLIGAAEKAGMKVPEDADNYEKEDYPHFWVFCTLQLGVPIEQWDAPWHNANVIAAIPEEDIRMAHAADIYDMGWVF